MTLQNSNKLPEQWRHELDSDEVTSSIITSGLKAYTEQWLPGRKKYGPAFIGMPLDQLLSELYDSVAYAIVEKRRSKEIERAYLDLLNIVNSAEHVIGSNIDFLCDIEETRAVMSEAVDIDISNLQTVKGQLLDLETAIDSWRNTFYPKSNDNDAEGSTD